MRERLRYGLVLLLLALAAVVWTDPAWSQEEPGDGPAAAEVDTSSPRTLLRSFLRAARAERWEVAGRALRVEGTSRVDDAAGAARDLFFVLDRTGLADAERLPSADDVEGRSSAALETPVGPVVVTRSDGVWGVARLTVEDLRGMAVRLETDPPQVLDVSLRPLLPLALRRRAFLMEHWQWLGLLLLGALAFALDRIVIYVARNVVAATLRRQTWLTEAADAAHHASRPVGLIAVAGLLWLVAPLLELPRVGFDVHAVFAEVLPEILVWVGVILVSYRLVDVLAARMAESASRTESRLDDQLVPLLRKTLKLLVTAAGILFVLDNLNVEIASLLAGIGLAGMAIALAAKDTLANLFGSVTVFLDRPFHVGDWVLVNDVEGTVEEVGFRSTRVRTFYNSLISVPNAQLVDTAIDNMGRREFRRFKTFVSVTYDTPAQKIEAFCSGIRGIVLAHDDMRHDYYEVYLNRFGPASLDILVYVFFRVPDWDAELRARQNFMLEILRLAEELGVEFAFPTQTLHVGSTPDRPLPPHESPPVDELDTVVHRFARGGAASRPTGTPEFHRRIGGADRGSAE